MAIASKQIQQSVWSNGWICVRNTEQCFIANVCIIREYILELVYGIMHEMEIRLGTIGCEPISDVQPNESSWEVDRLAHRANTSIGR